MERCPECGSSDISLVGADQHDDRILLYECDDCGEEFSSDDMEDE